MTRHLLALLGLALLSSPALAQIPGEADIVGTIRTFFDAFAARDSTSMQAVADPDAQLIVTSFAQNGAPVHRTLELAALIRNVASRDGAPVVETWWNPVVERHDNLATVWVDYNLWVGDSIDHCGRDAFLLARSPAGWIITGISDTQRREGCVAMVRHTPSDDALELDRLYASGVSFDRFLESARSRRNRWLSNHASSTVPDDLLSRLSTIRGPYRILAVAPASCSDSADTLPHVARLADSTPEVDLRVVEPSAGRAVLDAYPSPDGRPATPTYVILDASGRKVAVWVERPAALQRWALPARAELSEPEFVRRKSAWYDWDHGRSTMNTIVSLLENAGSF